MSPDTLTWIWLIGGFVLIGLELFLPGLISSFFGIAAILVALLRWAGLISGTMASFGVWVITSVILLLTVRQLALKWFPAERSFSLTDEDVEAVGTIVQVIEEVGTTKQGRIRFAGTTWPALSKEGSLMPGTQAKLLYRDNLVWVVEPISELGSSADLAQLETEKRLKE
ncbi:MAG TPA: NfeD family protein [Acidobacteriota bacterium]|jgi:membrane protein implicated in regulation of membrane protease activity|nr:NfeD family protein [Acidobacteriota bacterium]